MREVVLLICGLHPQRGSLEMIHAVLNCPWEKLQPSRWTAPSQVCPVHWEPVRLGCISLMPRAEKGQMGKASEL